METSSVIGGVGESARASQESGATPEKATPAQLAAFACAQQYGRGVHVLWSRDGQLHVMKWFAGHSIAVLVDARGELFTMLDGHAAPDGWRAALVFACALHHALTQAVADASRAEVRT